MSDKNKIISHEEVDAILLEEIKRTGEPQTDRESGEVLLQKFEKVLEIFDVKAVKLNVLKKESDNLKNTLPKPDSAKLEKRLNIFFKRLEKFQNELKRVWEEYKQVREGEEQIKKVKQSHEYQTLVEYYKKLKAGGETDSYKNLRDFWYDVKENQMGVPGDEGRAAQLFFEDHRDDHDKYVKSKIEEKGKTGKPGVEIIEQKPGVKKDKGADEGKAILFTANREAILTELERRFNDQEEIKKIRKIGVQYVLDLLPKKFANNESAKKIVERYYANNLGRIIEKWEEKGEGEPEVKPVASKPTPPVEAETSASETKETRQPLSKAGVESLKGEKHTKNEDNYLILPEQDLYAVFDGLGGHEAGQEASKMASEMLAKKMKNLPLDLPAEQYAQKLNVCLREINQALLKFGDKRGTTATIVKLCRDQDKIKAVVAHVGDSRAYLNHQGGFDYLTEDDGAASELKKMVDEGTLLFAERFSIREVLENARVAKDLKKLNKKEKDLFDLLFNQRNLLKQHLGYKEIEPTIKIIEVLPGDRILLTSDGIHDNLTSREIATTMLRGGEPKALASVLASKAQEISRLPVEQNMRAKPDDMTALVVEVLPAKETKKAEGTPVEPSETTTPVEESGAVKEAEPTAVKEDVTGGEEPPPELEKPRRIIDLPEKELLALIGEKRLTQAVADLVDPNTRGQAENNFKNIFTVEGAGRQALAEKLEPFGYTAEEFIQLWAERLHQPILDGLKLWVAQAEANLANASLGWWEKTKISAPERAKQVAAFLPMIAGVAGVGFAVSALGAGRLAVGAAAGLFVGLQRELKKSYGQPETESPASADGGEGKEEGDKKGGFFRRTFKKILGAGAGADKKIAEKKQALAEEKKVEDWFKEEMRGFFIGEGKSTQIAAFLSQGLRETSAAGVDTRGREANAALLHAAVMKKIEQETAEMKNFADSEKEAIKKRQTAQLDNLVAQLYASQQRELLTEIIAKDPKVLTVLKKITAFKDLDLDALAGKDKAGTPEQKSAGQKAVAMLLSGLACAGVGLGLAAAPELRAAIGVLAGGYLGAKFGHLRDQKEREKAFAAETEKLVEKAEAVLARVGEGAKISELKDADINEVHALANELRAPLSLGLLDDKVSLLMRAKNVLRRFEALEFEEKLKDARAKQLLDGLQANINKLKQSKQEVVDKLDRTSKKHTYFYTVYGAIAGGAAAFTAGELMKDLRDELGFGPYKEIPPDKAIGGAGVTGKVVAGMEDRFIPAPEEIPTVPKPTAEQIDWDKIGLNNSEAVQELQALSRAFPSLDKDELNEMLKLSELAKGQGPEHTLIKQLQHLGKSLDSDDLEKFHEMIGFQEGGKMEVDQVINNHAHRLALQENYMTPDGKYLKYPLWKDGVSQRYVLGLEEGPEGGRLGFSHDQTAGTKNLEVNLKAPKSPEELGFGGKSAELKPTLKWDEEWGEETTVKPPEALKYHLAEDLEIVDKGKGLYKGEFFGQDYIFHTANVSSLEAMATVLFDPQTGDYVGYIVGNSVHSEVLPGGLEQVGLTEKITLDLPSVKVDTVSASGGRGIAGGGGGGQKIVEEVAVPKPKIEELLHGLKPADYQELLNWTKNESVAKYLLADGTLTNKEVEKIVQDVAQDYKDNIGDAYRVVQDKINLAGINKGGSLPTAETVSESGVKKPGVGGVFEEMKKPVDVKGAVKEPAPVKSEASEAIKTVEPKVELETSSAPLESETLQPTADRPIVVGEVENGLQKVSFLDENGKMRTFRLSEDYQPKFQDGKLKIQFDGIEQNVTPILDAEGKPQIIRPTLKGSEPHDEVYKVIDNKLRIEEEVESTDAVKEEVEVKSVKVEKTFTDTEIKTKSHVEAPLIGVEDSQLCGKWLANGELPSEVVSGKAVNKSILMAGLRSLEVKDAGYEDLLSQGKTNDAAILKGQIAKSLQLRAWSQGIAPDKLFAPEVLEKYGVK